MLARNQRRIHTCRHSLVTRRRVGHTFGNAEQLDHITRLAREFNGLTGHASDSFAVHALERHVRVKSQAGKNRHLLRRVERVDVGGGVGLGIAQFGCHGERVVKAGARGIHRVKNEVRRAVNDAHHAVDAVTGEAVAQRANNWNRPGDSGLVVELRTYLLSRRVEFRAVIGEQGLVRCDHVGTRVQRLQDVGASGLEAAHDFNHDVGTQNE